MFGSHDLDVGLPHDLAALVDVLPQIAFGKVGIETAHGRRLGIGEVAHACLGEEVILDVVLLAWCTCVKRVNRSLKERPFRILSVVVVVVDAHLPAALTHLKVWQP